MHAVQRQEHGIFVTPPSLPCMHCMHSCSLSIWSAGCIMRQWYSFYSVLLSRSCTYRQPHESCMLACKHKSLTQVTVHIQDTH
jgi:hypothetical protein